MSGGTHSRFSQSHSLHFGRWQPNGLAQAQRRDRETPRSISCHIKRGAYPQRRSRCRLQPVLGAFLKRRFPDLAYDANNDCNK
jgi:hypothetical protein